MRFKHGSRFVPLAELGYPYNPHLRQARRKLKQDGIPDIYKVVFPIANYTNPIAQLNGVASDLYAQVFASLAGRINRPICLVQSEHGIDELMPGQNRITYIHGQRLESVSLHFSAEWSDLATQCFHEREVLVDAVSMFERCLTTEIGLTLEEKIIREVVVQNAALIITVSETAQNQAQITDESIAQCADELRAWLRQLHHIHEHRAT
jgi:anthranilate phosphoribosyltransferase